MSERLYSCLQEYNVSHSLHPLRIYVLEIISHIYTYTCVVVNSDARFTTTWTLTPDGGVPSCIVQHIQPDDMDACGPGRVFTSSLTGQSGDNTSFTSTLSVESVSESLNRTRVECLDAGLETVGSKDICIVGESRKCHHAP